MIEMLQTLIMWDVWPAGLQTLVVILLKIVAILAPLMVAVAYYTYFERKVIGYMHVRIGPNRVGRVVGCSR